MKLHCKKYKLSLAQDELESHRCLQKFEHSGRKGICPYLINAETGNPYWQEIYKQKEEPAEDILEKTSKAIARILKASKEIEDKGGIFNV
jgi:hypothetical protein